MCIIASGIDQTVDSVGSGKGFSNSELTRWSFTIQIGNFNMNQFTTMTIFFRNLQSLVQSIK